MVMEFLGEQAGRACQCRQAQAVLGVAGCCAAAESCLPASELPPRCDAPRWPAFVEKPEVYGFEYRTTCDALRERQDDPACDGSPIAWRALTVELCAGRPVIASFRSPGSAVGHTLVVKGFSTHGGRRVLLVDPAQLCPPGRDCEGELDEGFWVSYEEYAAGWGGRAHWVDFYGIRRAGPGKARCGVRQLGPTRSWSGGCHETQAMTGARGPRPCRRRRGRSPRGWRRPGRRRRRSAAPVLPSACGSGAAHCRALVKRGSGARGRPLRPRSLARLVEQAWPEVHALARRQRAPAVQDADDLTQAYFAHSSRRTTCAGSRAGTAASGRSSSRACGTSCRTRGIMRERPSAAAERGRSRSTTPSRTAERAPSPPTRRRRSRCWHRPSGSGRCGARSRP